MLAGERGGTCGIDAMLAAYGYRPLQSSEPPRRPVCFPVNQAVVPVAYSGLLRFGSSSGGRQ
jgi:hypothetical protein